MNEIRRYFGSTSGLLAATAEWRFLLLMFCLLLCLQRAASAQTLETWTDTDGTGLWSHGNNWNPTTGQGGPNGVNVEIPCCTGGPTGGVILDVSASIVNLTIDTNASLSITNGSELTVTGTNITNNGTLAIQDGLAGLSGGGSLDFTNTVTLSGTGKTFLDSAVSASIQGSGTLINQQTISGEGGGTISVVLQNESPNGTITGGPSTSPLFIVGAVTNSGTISGQGFSSIQFRGNTVQNAGGTIDATDSGEVLLNDCTIIGGNIGSASQGALSSTLNTLTITGIFSITSNSKSVPILTSLVGDITNNGQIVVTGPAGVAPAKLRVSGAVTLQGTGQVELSGSGASIAGTGTLTNLSPHVINGGGAGSMSVSNVVNQSTINGVTIASKIVNNTNGTIGADGTPVTINGGKVTGGTINAGVNPGVTATDEATFSGLKITGGTQGVFTTISAVFDGRSAANTISTTVQIPDGDKLTLEGPVIINVPGEIYLDAVTNHTDVAVEGSVGVNGTGGFVTSTSPNNYIDSIVMAGPSGATSSLTINLPTVNFEGTIGDGSFPITFGALTTVTNGGYPLIINATNSTFKNLGTMVENDGTIEILGNFTNYNATSGTLTGGTYTLNGTLLFNNANVVTNAAKVNLTGNGQIVNQNGANGLANLNTTASKATFDLSGGQNFETVGTYTNEGANSFSANSVFSVGGTGTNYNQSGTTAFTTVDGRLSVPAGGLTGITGGLLQGAGQFDGDVSIGNAAVGATATFIVGDNKKSSALVTMANNYTQLATGVMDVQIGGTTVGTQYSQLSVTGTVTLGGTLNATLINNFKPVTGDQFTIINAPSGLTGTFATVHLPAKFQVVYNPTTVVLEYQ